MLIFELIGGICMAFFIAKSNSILAVKELLAKHKIWYDTDKYLEGEPYFLYTKNIPPFDCPKCLSFWITICICQINLLTLQESILYGFISYTIAKLYSK